MTRYLWPASVVGLAMIAGAALVPGSWEMAFMKLRDRDFASAERALEEKFLSGARDRGVLIPLSELYVRNGRIDKAIHVLKKYAEARPRERDVAERLAVLMKEAQEFPQAAAQLERLAKGNPPAERLRELDRLHDIQENNEGRIAALSRLVRLPEATAQEFFALTNLLAASDRKAEALTAAFNAVKRWPADCPIGLVQTMAALAIDTGRADILDAALLPWAKRQSSAPTLAAVAATLIEKSAPDQALAVVAASPAVRRQDPAAIVLLARLMADRGDKAQALAKLQALHAGKKLPVEAAAFFAGTALALNKTNDALGFIRERGTAAFDDAMLLYAASQAPAASARDWLDWAAQDLAAGAPRPIPAARVAIARGDRSAATTFAAEAKANLSPETALNVAQLYVDLQDIETATAIFEAAKIDPNTTPPHELGRASFVAVAVKDAERALALTSKLMELNRLPDTQILRARALALNARYDEALKILDAIGSARVDAELAKVDVYKAAGRLAELKSLLIERLQSADLIEPRRTNYVFALNEVAGDLGPAAAPLAPTLVAELTAGAPTGPAQEARLTLLSRIAPAEALPFLKIAAEKDLARAGFAYVEALKKANATAELRLFLAHAAQHAKDAKLREGYLYESIKWGGADALPLLAARAQSEGGKWFYAYDAALKKYGTPAVRKAALTAFANNTNLKPELRKQIAFQILELGGTAEAEALFRSLAGNAAPDSDVMRQLAFIWGPRPKPDAMTWLRTRAAASPHEQRPAWAAMLLNAGDATTAIATLEGEESAAALRVLADAYVQTKDIHALKRLVPAALRVGPDAKTAGHLARAAEALSLNAVASQAHEAAAGSDPGAWLAAGRTAFFAGDHSRAQGLLERALTHKAGAQTSFYLAEAFWAQRRRADAVEHYETALDRLGKTPEDRQMRLVALARLKRHADANAELAASKGDDALDAQSVYAGALLDQGDTSRAAGALGLAP